MSSVVQLNAPSLNTFYYLSLSTKNAIKKNDHLNLFIQLKKNCYESFENSNLNDLLRRLKERRWKMKIQQRRENTGGLTAKVQAKVKIDIIFMFFII